MGWCLQSIFLMLLACHRKKLWPKTFFTTACKFWGSSSKYYVIACKFWGSWHDNFETLPSVSHPVHSKYVIPTTGGKLELSSPRDNRKTWVLVTSRKEKKTFLPARGNQSRSFSVHLFSRHFWLSWPGGAELGKMSFTIEFVYENYKF